MHIFNSFSHHVVPLFREIVLPAISEQQKKIMFIAAIIFSSLALTYIFIRRDRENRTIEFLDKATETKYLPKKLESLTVLTKDFADEHVKQLPKNLKRLAVIYECPNLTEACIENLPEELTSLGLPKHHFNDETIKELPRTLTCLTLGGKHLTDAAIKDLPPNIRELCLRECDQLTEAAINDLPTNLEKITLFLSKNAKLNTAAIGDFPENIRQIQIFLID